MYRPRIRIAGLTATVVMAALVVLFPPVAYLKHCPFPTAGSRVAAVLGPCAAFVLRRLTRRTHPNPDVPPPADITRQWRELDVLQNALDARDEVPTKVRAMLSAAYDYLIIGREPGAATWAGRQVEAWLARH